MSTQDKTSPFVRRLSDGMGVSRQSSLGRSQRTITPKAKPSCTHIMLDRLYGPFLCDNCGKPSPLNWLYVCAEDTSPTRDLSDRHVAIPKDGADAMFHDILEMTDLGLSDSVIGQVKQGLYTSEQIETLKEQKRHLNEVLIFALAGPSNEPVRRRFRRGSACQIKFCQRCRPYMLDRSWTSFESVFNNEINPINAVDLLSLPVHDASILKTIGLTSPPNTAPSLSQLYPIAEIPPFNNAGNDTGNNSGLSTPESGDQSPSSDSDFWSDSDEEEQGDLEDDDTSQHYTNAAGSTFISARPRSFSKSAPDLTLRTLRRVSGSLADYTPPRSTENSSDSITSFASQSTLMTSRFSENFKDTTEEMDVNGGVALTSEAVRTHTPDIITSI